MKNYRNAIAALILAFVVSTSTFAEGVIHTDKTPPPPPTQVDNVTLTDTVIPAPEEDTLTQIVLSLLETLIPLL